MTVTLVSSVLVAYLKCLRATVVQPAWCDSTKSCAWMGWHDALVFYLYGMTLFHYLNTVLTSPGVALPPGPLPPHVGWKATHGQGGFWGKDVVFDADRERALLHRYTQHLWRDEARTPSQTTTTTCPTATNPTMHFFPEPHSSYCQHCQIARPPRTHHCRTCRRCVLQYDHHCDWINNCIGYNNYRSFIGTLFFLTASCWYGTALLVRPFYQNIQAQIEREGWKWRYSHGTGLLNLPPLTEWVRVLGADDHPERTNMVVNMVYPLLVLVGAILTVFLGQHVNLMSQAYTTLEHKIVLQEKLSTLLWSSKTNEPKKTPSVNPFHQGSWSRNISQILGEKWWTLLIPMVSWEPPSPRVTDKKDE